MVNISVLASGNGTNLQALIDAGEQGKLGGGRINAVISSKADAYALTRAKNAGINTAVVAKVEHPDRDEFTRALIDALRAAETELVVFAGFNFILTPDIVRAFPNRMLNVHPSLIPSFCGYSFYGLNVHKAVLEYGVKLTGATVHFVNEQTDGGPIIIQKAVEVKEGDTPEILQRRVMEQAEWVILPQAVSLFCQGKLNVDGRIVRIRED